MTAFRQAEKLRIGSDDANPKCCIRRRTGVPVSAILKQSQGKRLIHIAARNRKMAADDVRNLLLERLGLIERIGALHPHRLGGYSTVEWTVTDLGHKALRDIAADYCPPVPAP